MKKHMNALLVALVVSLVGPSVASAQTPVLEYYHLDAIGSVRAVSNQNGQLIRRHDFFPFGEEYLPQPLTGDVHRFTGKPRDAETGLDYFGARHRAPQYGRFVTTDPVLNVGAAVADAQRWNRYEYARGNPLRFVDPDGRDITLFYRPPQAGKAFDFGHVLVYVRNDKTGESGYLDFFPMDGTAMISPVDQDRLLRHASVTIDLTSAQEAAALSAIREKKANVPGYTVFGSTCVTQCKDVFRAAGLGSGLSVTPSQLWSLALSKADVTKRDKTEAILWPVMGKEYARGKSAHVFDPKALLNVLYMVRTK